MNYLQTNSFFVFALLFCIFVRSPVHAMCENASPAYPRHILDTSPTHPDVETHSTTFSNILNHLSIYFVPFSGSRRSCKQQVL